MFRSGLRSGVGLVSEVVAEVCESDCTCVRRSFTAANTSRIVAAMSLVRCSKASSLACMALSLALTGAELALLDVLFEAIDCLARDAVDSACFFFLCGGVGSSTVDVDDDDDSE